MYKEIKDKIQKKVIKKLNMTNLKNKVNQNLKCVKIKS